MKMNERRLRVDAGHEVSVYAHGLHGAGLHNVVQGHIRSLQGTRDAQTKKTRRHTNGYLKTHACMIMCVCMVKDSRASV